MSERAVTFGPGHGLVGVYSAPESPVAGAARAVIMSNIGMHHRAGPFRLYVELARRLEAAGLHVLRFDLSGMGDSAMRRDGRTPGERAALDLDDAMTWLQEQHGISEFVLVGLCSGVDSTHAAAVRDPRVVGAAFIDGYSYPTPGYRVRHYTLRPLQLGRWMRLGRRIARGERRSAATSAQASVFEREIPTHAQFAADVTTMTERGTQLLFVYTGGVNQRFNAPRQVAEMVGPGARTECIAVELMRDADHVFSRTAQRAALYDRLVHWATSLPR